MVVLPYFQFGPPLRGGDLGEVTDHYLVFEQPPTRLVLSGGVEITVAAELRTDFPDLENSPRSPFFVIARVEVDEFPGDVERGGYSLHEGVRLIVTDELAV